MEVTVPAAKSLPAVAQPTKDSPVSTAIPVLALGRGLTLTAVLRLLGEAGIPTFALCPKDDFAARSRWYRSLPGDPPFGEFDRLPELLESLPFERAVLMPCADDWAVAVAELPESLAARFPASISLAPTVRALADKWCFADLLVRQDIPHPRTRLISSENDLADLPDRDFRNTILKPLSSVDFLSRHGVKGHIVQTREQARVVASQIELPILLQDLVPGPPDAGYFLEGFIDQGGEVCALLARQRIRMYPPGLGNSSYTMSIPVAEMAPAVQPFFSMLRAVRYRGIFDAEFKRDPRDGILKLIEVNARAWWYIGFAGRCGVDVCRMAYADALGLPVSPVLHYQTGRRCFFLANELRAWRRAKSFERTNAQPAEPADPADTSSKPSPSLWALIRSWFGADEALFCWKDPLPAVSYLCQQLHFRLRPKARREGPPTQHDGPRVPGLGCESRDLENDVDNQDADPKGRVKTEEPVAGD
jgi:D-aspartate ligase